MTSWRDINSAEEFDQYKKWVARNDAIRHRDEFLSEAETHNRNALFWSKVELWAKRAALGGAAAGLVIGVYGVALLTAPAATLATYVAPPAMGYQIAGAVAAVAAAIKEVYDRSVDGRSTAEAVAAAEDALAAAQDPRGSSRN